jgi:hypothetical protein
MSKTTSLSLSFAVLALLAGCGTTPSTSSTCPKTVDDYKAGEATSELVLRCMGKPSHEDHNPDGRYVYLYDINESTKLTFLFDKSGSLIRTRGYNQK